MLTALVLLVVTDILLVAALFWQRREQHSRETVRLLADVSEERRLFQELTSKAQASLQKHMASSLEVAGRVEKMAAELDEELRQTQKHLSAHLEGLTDELRRSVEGPFAEAAQRQLALESLGKKLEDRTVRLQRLVNRAETLVEVINKPMSYGKARAYLDERQGAEVRALMAQGASAGDIASELGLSQTEVLVLAKPRAQGLV